jgi:UDP-glucose 4-epimerase
VNTFKQTILVTGGAGYIGSHTVIQLLNAGFNVVVLDNLCNSNIEVISRIKKIAGIGPDFVEADIRDRDRLQNIFASYPIDAVIHFAGLKAVGESEIDPLRYYDNNVLGSVVLFEEMARAEVKAMFFHPLRLFMVILARFVIENLCLLSQSMCMVAPS